MNLSILKNKKTIIAVVLVTIIALVILFFSFIKSGQSKIVPNADEQAASNLSASDIYIENRDVSLANINPNGNDQTGFLVKDGAIVTLRDSKILKYEGQTSDSTKSLTTGLNSATVVAYGSEVKMTNVSTETTVEYSNGIFISGEKAKANLIDSSINTFGFGSPGAVVATKGTLETEHTNIITKVKSSPALIITHKQGSALIASNSMLETNGSASPIVKSKGTIDINNSVATANSSRIAVIEGGSLNIKDSTLITSGTPDTETETPSAILITNTEDSSSINITDSSININSKMPYYKIATIFDINNSSASINLNNIQINYGSSSLMNLTISSVDFTTDGNTTQGNITLDNQSELNLNLKNSSIFMGAINNLNSKGKVTIVLDKTSKLILTGDTYITSLENESKDNSNIIYNNYKLYVNGTIIN